MFCLYYYSFFIQTKQWSFLHQSQLINKKHCTRCLRFRFRSFVCLSFLRLFPFATRSLTVFLIATFHLAFFRWACHSFPAVPLLSTDDQLDWIVGHLLLFTHLVSCCHFIIFTLPNSFLDRFSFKSWYIWFFRLDLLIPVSPPFSERQFLISYLVNSIYASKVSM